MEVPRKDRPIRASPLHAHSDFCACRLLWLFFLRDRLCVVWRGVVLSPLHPQLDTTLPDAKRTDDALSYEVDYASGAGLTAETSEVETRQVSDRNTPNEGNRQSDCLLLT